MGYNLTIGQVEAGTLECEEGEYAIRIEVTLVKFDSAPRDDSPTDGTNQRWPDYSAWAGFCRDTGLYSLFYDGEHGLIRRHPGVFALTADHLAQIKAAHSRLKLRSDGAYALHGGRMQWLEYWVEWALANCSRPGIKNT